MLTFEDAKKALAAVEKGSELVAALESHINEVVEAEKRTGIEFKNKANREAEGVRKRLLKFEEALGVESSKEDFDAKLNEVKTKLTAPPSTGKEADIKTHPEFMALNQRLSERERKDAEREEKDKKEREKYVATKFRSIAQEAAIKAKVHEKALDDAVNLIVPKMKFREEDDSCYIDGDDGKPVLVEVYTQNFVKDRPWMVTNNQGPGGGGGPGGGEGRPNDKPDNISQRTKELRERQAQYNPI